MRVQALQAYLLYGAARQCWKDLLILTPLLAKRALPLGVGLDAVAVADVHCGGAAQPLRGALQGGDAPIHSVLHVDVEGGLIELDDVNTVGLQRQRFLIEEFGKGHGKLLAAAVVAVGHGIDNGQRTR